MSATKKIFKVIIGLGKTGFACVKFFMQHNIPCAVNDTRDQPPYLDQLKKEFPSVQVKLGGLNKELLAQAQEIIVSPGISIHEPEIAELINRGVAAIGDIELFARLAKAPICAITGSNAKSTVTALVHEMAKLSGINVRMGGNIGTPALELIQVNEPDLYVLEISSFQLETTFSLHAAAATILNICDDHMDRYDNLAAYITAKQRIYHQAEFAVVNRDDANTQVQHIEKQQIISFGLSAPKAGEFGLLNVDNHFYLAYGNEILLHVNEMLIKGKHNWANALAALALGYALKLPISAMLNALRQFPGLLHRCQLVGEKHQVAWYNDSKGTNVGATVAAIEGLGSAVNGKIILIAGGQSKKADFTPIIPCLKNFVATVLLLGEDAHKIENTIKGATSITQVSDMRAAVIAAKNLAKPGDAVLLSPACASFDMFNNFEHRGEVFMNLVKELIL